MKRVNLSSHNVNERRNFAQRKLASKNKFEQGQLNEKKKLAKQYFKL